MHHEICANKVFIYCLCGVLFTAYLHTVFFLRGQGYDQPAKNVTFYLIYGQATYYARYKRSRRIGPNRLAIWTVPEDSDRIIELFDYQYRRLIDIIFAKKIRPYDGSK